MNQRIGFKDLLFIALILALLSAVALAIWQFGYQEKRLNDLRSDVQRLLEGQKQQLTLLESLRQHPALPAQPAASASAPVSAPALAQGLQKMTLPDGTQRVTLMSYPMRPHDPRFLADYAPGDRLVENLSAEPAIISPLLVTDHYGSVVQGGVLESLLTENPETLELEPLLAESFEILPDKLTYRFHLRPHLVFSDGHPLTTADVRFSFDTILNKEIDCDSVRSGLNQLEGYKVLDERTIEFHFKETYFKALEQIGGMPIIPEHIYRFKKAEEFNQRSALLIGSGPYRLGEWQRGQVLYLVRNEKYWGPQATFDRLVYRFISNPQAAFQAFQNGEIDVFTPQAEQYEKFSKDPEFLKSFTCYNFPVPNGGYRYVGWNQRRPFFRDTLTRQALTMLMDRQAMIKTFSRGLAVEITGPFSPMTPQADTAIEPWPYDVARAKEKLAQAGWKLNEQNLLVRDGQVFRFALTFPSGNPIAERMASYIKSQLALAGIDMTLNPLEFAVLVTKLDEREFDAAMLSWTGQVEGDPYQIWHSMSAQNKGSNFIGFSNPQADELIEAGRRELVDTRRMEIWHRFHRLLHQEQPYTFLAAAMERAFINGRFKNTRPYRTGLLSSDWYVPLNQQKYR